MESGNPEIDFIVGNQLPKNLTQSSFAREIIT